MAFELPDLPFAKDALGDHMSAETLDYHHGKHHNAYVQKTNGMLGEKGLEGANLTTVIKRAHEAGDKGLFNNSAQIWNHTFFWHGLAPEGSTKPSEKLQAMIDSDFGSTDKLLEALQNESANHFASGWGWLILNNGKLEVTSLHDADTPVAHGMTPLFTVDVWEHAYYIDYRNARPDYLKSVLHNIVNWDFVSENLDGHGTQRADQLG
ncbi:superoxide dismutase [Sphingomicrobium sediminis]|uniref:Superoxide dismutase n=1 Tax=Sphingomicrobium sediminis TaxID=2950949 RepID=A0A9X2J2D5_9SPHN|nr:superoxide dismutase [Sphingomicrobium sediminis]MCM8556915.1 superoxide dismutase [Sphingomicrobium sediminis]